MEEKWKYQNNQGMSLISVLIAIGLLGTVSLGVMKLAQNSANIQVGGFSSLEYIQLADEFRFLLNNPKDCKASLAEAGNEISFTTSDIQTEPTQAGMDPSIGIELFVENTAGVKRKRFSYQDTDASKYGGIQITSLELIMPDYAGGALPSGIYTAEIIMQGTRRITTTKRRSLPTLKKKILISLNTVGAVSEVTDCFPTGTPPVGAVQLFEPGTFPPGNTDIGGLFRFCALSTSGGRVKSLRPSMNTCSLIKSPGAGPLYSWSINVDKRSAEETICGVICF